MNIYVDIDETICVHEESDGPRDYRLAKPLYNNINKINNFFENGHHNLVYPFLIHGVLLPMTPIET